ncbi:hypothetical protein HK096_005120 [Nowakowskiella sp. JEL0078]|nr:hypothetical protein HK096_005120 [Nowakowskiella sp. JEL0078]
MKIIPVPIFRDNYAYLVIDDKLGLTFAVDPAVPSKVLDAAKSENIEISAILTTHNHADHSGGNAELLKLFPNLEIYGLGPRISGLTREVFDRKSIYFTDSIKITPLFTPCHTTDSVSYYVQDNVTGEGVVFTGDTLFIAGCGRFFEGSADDMHKSLNSVLASLPKETKVYCGHEYTKSNLKFAQFVEPENQVVISKLKWCDSVERTIPSTIGEELEINPFMRLSQPAVQLKTGSKEDVETMNLLREMKNKFK